jgi:cobalt-zinc-cadmium efflux system membrane fusion protein
MKIAPLDHLWVRGNVSELDADQVELGQNMRILFPSSNLTLEAKVGYIDKAIDPDSRSAKFRTTINNPDGRLKAGMFVRMSLDIPPATGNTIIPRIAMVSVDRYDYVFVKKPGKANRFERRLVAVVKENNDVVIVTKPSPGHPGLTPGEEVVTTGSLILEQMYEDRVMTEGGLLASGPEAGSVNSLDQPTPVAVTVPSHRR